jgi:hypothetical protein
MSRPQAVRVPVQSSLLVSVVSGGQEVRESDEPVDVGGMR